MTSEPVKDVTSSQFTIHYLRFTVSVHAFTVYGFTGLMAATRTQREIRQRAPFWLLASAGHEFRVHGDRGSRRFLESSAVACLDSDSGVSLRTEQHPAVGGSSIGLVRKIINFNKTAAENEQCSRKADDLEVALRNAQQAESENERLRGLLNLKEKTGYDSIAARVIARDPSAWFNTITINQGSSVGKSNSTCRWSTAAASSAGSLRSVPGRRR